MNIARLASRFSNPKQTAEAMGYHTFPSISGAEIDTKQWQGQAVPCCQYSLSLWLH